MTTRNDLLRPKPPRKHSISVILICKNEADRIEGSTHTFLPRRNKREVSAVSLPSLGVAANGSFFTNIFFVD